MIIEVCSRCRQRIDDDKKLDGNVWNCFVYKSKVSFNDYSVAVWEKGKLLGYKKLSVNLDTRRKSWTIKITDTIKVPKVHMDIVDENLIKIQIYEFKNIA